MIGGSAIAMPPRPIHCSHYQEQQFSSQGLKLVERPREVAEQNLEIQPSNIRASP